MNVPTSWPFVDLQARQCFKSCFLTFSCFRLMIAFLFVFWAMMQRISKLMKRKSSCRGVWMWSGTRETEERSSIRRGLKLPWDVGIAFSTSSTVGFFFWLASFRTSIGRTSDSPDISNSQPRSGIVCDWQRGRQRGKQTNKQTNVRCLVIGGAPLLAL